MLKELCQFHTNLTDEDIEQLESLSNNLFYFSEISSADYFIDCFSKNGDYGIVVAHSKPIESIYNNIIIGQKVYIENEPAVFSAYFNSVQGKEVKGITQEFRIVKQYTVPIKNKTKTIGVLVMEKDATKNINKDNKMAEMIKITEQLTEQVRESEKISISDYIKEGILIFDNNQHVIYANLEASLIFNKLGYDNNLIGYQLKDFLFPITQNININELLDSSKEITIGNTFLKYRFNKPENKDSSKLLLLIEDITQLKNKEKELINKSAMMQEMHHRIKNNLQLIASFLNLQLGRIDHPQTKEILSENISRVRGISAIHEILCETNSYETIDLLKLLEQLKLNMQQYGNSEQKEIYIEITGDSTLVKNDKAVSIAIVLTELITNSIKHGFYNRERGIIKIDLVKGKYRSFLTVTDDGVGFDVHNKYDSIGLEIIKATVREKLDGECIINSDNQGTRTYFDFESIE